MKNYEVYTHNPLKFELLNNGVSKVAEIGLDQEQLKTLRFELETFVCTGEYERGLERILSAYLDGLGKPEQKAVWVSGFFGSGKSHLLKMLRYLWADFKFPDGASARSIARLPTGVNDLFRELTTKSRQYGGVKAAAGTLGAGNMENVRLAFLQLIFRAADLPENLAAARFVLFLKQEKYWDNVCAYLRAKHRTPEQEIRNLYVSTPLAEALVAADPKYGSAKEALAAIRAEFPNTSSPTIEDTLDLVRRIFGNGQELPCTLLVVDEIQQFIGEKLDRAADVNEIAEHYCTDLDSRLLLVGAGQSALTATPTLSKLQHRFVIKVPLADTDVENVIRQTVLAKQPQRVADIKKVIEANLGEIHRHLQNSRLAPSLSDDPYYGSDYPLLPVRRRFWEKVLRNVDVSGTTAQLRTQLKIVYEAARATADKELGNVVPGDFIYQEIASDLLQTGMLQREYYETIAGLDDRTRNGKLKSRLCALAFLISKLPREGGADDNVRADADTLADLLIEDLKNDGAKLRQEIPQLLDALVKEGKLMLVANEYCLQTPEGARWTDDFNRRRTQILNDDSKLNDERETLLRSAIEQALRSLNISQGTSRQSRKLEVALSNSRPTQPEGALVFWVRHGWAEPERKVAEDARAAGNMSPMIFGFLPRERHDEIRQNLASALAARDTIEHHGNPTTPPAIQARDSVETIRKVAEQTVQNCVREVLKNAKVFLGGGSESVGVELQDKVGEAAEGALQRLFDRFGDADHANWPQVLNSARAGTLSALQAVGYSGDVVQHPVCKQVMDFIRPVKKGREVRDNFKKAPFGWPQDGIDAALVVLTLAGNLRCEINGQGTDAKSLNQTQISNASFYVDIPPLSATQKLDLKALFQKLGVSTQSGQESSAAAQFLAKLVDLADASGGEPPQPERPSKEPVRQLQTLSGNAQLLEIHRKKLNLERAISEWSKVRYGIAKRLPRWDRLKDLYSMANGLSDTGEVAAAMAAIESSRTLLSEPDAVDPLIQKVQDALRQALNKLQGDLDYTFASEEGKLQNSAVWQTLTEDQRQQLIGQFNLRKPAAVAVKDEDEIIATLQENSLANRQTLIEAVPQRFQRALEEATRWLEPKATRVSLPAATIRNEQDLESWVLQVSSTVKEQLKKGPVIL